MKKQFLSGDKIELFSLSNSDNKKGTYERIKFYYVF